MSRRHWNMNPRRWQATRRAVFARDGYRCRRCGNVSRLEADHVVPLEDDEGQSIYEIDGIQTLCRTCHLSKTAAENSVRRGDPVEGRAEWESFVDEISGN